MELINSVRSHFLMAGFVFLAGALFIVSGDGRAEENYTGNMVEVAGEKGSWTLTVNGRPFYIKGVGVGHALSRDRKVDLLQLAKELGANTVRTWGASQGTRDYLDRAWSYGLLVDAGLWLNPVSTDGTGSYLTDSAYVEEVRGSVLNYVRDNRDHPAVLAWNIGNETIYWTKDEKERVGFCLFLEKLIREVHRADPYHPVIYTSAFTVDAAYIAQYVPSLDILGVNVYGGVQQTHLELRAGQKIPLVFTEFGPVGPWDLPKDGNQRPQELTDRQKAWFYEKEARAVSRNKGYNLGGFAFYLGETSQISLTWWNLNHGDTRKLSYIKLQDLYRGAGDQGQYPFIKNMSLSKSAALSPGEEVRIEIEVSRESENIAYAYLASTEIDSDLVEDPNDRIPLSADADGCKAVIKAPDNPGLYRIYAVLSDRDNRYTSTLSRTIRVQGGRASD